MLHAHNLPAGAVGWLLKAPDVKETVCVLGMKDGQSTGVLLSVPSGLVLPQYSHLHKVPACSPPNRTIYP